MNFFILFLWVIFDPLDPDQNFTERVGSGSVPEMLHLQVRHADYDASVSFQVKACMPV